MSSGRKCLFCGRICKTKDGAFRHVMNKHGREALDAAEELLAQKLGPEKE